MLCVRVVDLLFLVVEPQLRTLFSVFLELQQRVELFLLVAVFLVLAISTFPLYDLDKQIRILFYSETLSMQV